jgi:hypothetical protein
MNVRHVLPAATAVCSVAAFAAAGLAVGEWRVGPPQVAAATSDRAIALFARATELIQAGRDAEAGALIARARRQPLLVTERAVSGGLDDRSPAVWVINLGIAMAERAEDAAGRADPAEARRWAERVRDLATQTLDTPQPTLEALMTARTLDQAAGRAEREVARRTGTASDRARVSRDPALRALYESEILPAVMAARDRRNAAYARAALQAPGGGEQAQAIRQAEQVTAEQDAWLAADLIALCRSERGRLLRQPAEPAPGER